MLNRVEVSARFFGTLSLSHSFSRSLTENGTYNVYIMGACGFRKIMMYVYIYRWQPSDTTNVTPRISGSLRSSVYTHAPYLCVLIRVKAYSPFRKALRSPLPLRIKDERTAITFHFDNNCASIIFISPTTPFFVSLLNVIFFCYIPFLSVLIIP